jgi:hypothetical protein
MYSIKKLFGSIFLFSMLQGAAEPIYLEESLSLPPEMHDFPPIYLDDGKAFLNIGNFMAGKSAQVPSLETFGNLFNFVDSIKGLRETSLFVLDKDSPVGIEFPTLENMYKIKKSLMTEEAEVRINRVSLAKTIKNALINLDAAFEGIYDRIDTIFKFAQVTKCFSPACKKSEKNRNLAKEKIYQSIDFLIVDFYTSIVSTMNIINLFNSQTIEKHYQHGTTSQVLCVNMLYKSFNAAFFNMLKAFEYINDEEDVFVLQPERISALHRLHKKENDYYVGCVKERDQCDPSLISIHAFLVPVRGFYVHHIGDRALLFNNGQLVRSAGILINELRNVNAMETSVNEYQAFEVEYSSSSEHNFCRKNIGLYLLGEKLQHNFVAFDLQGKDSFGKKFVYMQNPEFIDFLLEKILYFESLIKDVKNIHRIAKSKASLTHEECREIEECIARVKPDIIKALLFDAKNYKALVFDDSTLEHAAESSSYSAGSVQGSSQSHLQALEECSEQLERVMHQCEKVAYDYYEKKIIAEQEAIRSAVASGTIYAETKKGKGRNRGKQQVASKKMEKKEAESFSKKEKQALSHKALKLLGEYKVNARMKKRELDLLANEIMKQLDPQKIVKIHSNIDGSHEIFHAEGAESVTRAGHGNNPEYSASVANQFLIDRVRQLEVSKHFIILKGKLESNK